MLRLFYAIFLWLLPLCASASQALVGVDHVMDGKLFVTAGGDTIRLADMRVPATGKTADGQNNAAMAEPLGQEAKQALGIILSGKKIRFDSDSFLRDRHNWLVGQVTTQEGVWVQGAMLSGGWAMVDSFADARPETLHDMLAREAQARVAKRGIWATANFRVITPKEAQNFINQFKLVEGNVVSAHLYHGNLYINFSRRWKGQFAVFISHTYLSAFSLPQLLALPGKTIRVRGWIDYHNAPSLAVTNPWQIELSQP